MIRSQAVALCIHAAAVAACPWARAEEPPVPSYDVRDIVELATVGAWTEGDVTREARLVKLDTGLEDAELSGVIDWVERDFGDRTKELVASQRLTDCAGQPIRDFTIDKVEQPEGGDVLLTLRASSSSQARGSLQFIVTGAREARPVGCPGSSN